MSRTQMPDWAGLRQYRKARSTGTHVAIFHNVEAKLDDDDGTMPYSTVCDEHGGVVSHATLELARLFSSCPEDWCPTCTGEVPDPHNTKEEEL